MWAVRAELVAPPQRLINILQKSTLQNQPDSLLGVMFSPRNEDLAKPDLLGQYFFDRDPECFRVVLNFLRSGVLERPPAVPPLTFQAELEYWQVDVPEPCDGVDGGEEQPAPSDALVVSPGPIPSTLKNVECKLVVKSLLYLMQRMDHPLDWYTFSVNFKADVITPPDKPGCEGWADALRQYAPYVVEWACQREKSTETLYFCTRINLAAKQISLPLSFMQERVQNPVVDVGSALTMMLTDDVLALILDELHPTAALDVRALHSCLLVSRGTFHLAAARLWPPHFWYLTGTGIARKPEPTVRGYFTLHFINPVIEQLCKPGDQALASAGDAWRVWRCKIYLRSLTALCVSPEASLGPALITPLMGKIRSVTIKTESAGPTAQENLWLDWIKPQMSSGDGASEVVYAGEPVKRVLEFATFRCVTAVAVTYWWSDELDHLAAMVLNNTGVRNLRFVEAEYMGRPIERKLEKRWEPIKRPGALQQLRISYDSDSHHIIRAGFYAQFASLTHLIVPMMHTEYKFRATELAGCAATLTHLSVCLWLTADDVEQQVVVLGSCINLEELVGLRPTTTYTRTRLGAALSRLVKLRKLKMTGDYWDGLPLTSLLNAMPRLRDLELNFSSTTHGGRVVIPFRRLSTVTIRGITPVVIEDIDAVIEAGWGRLERMRIESDAIGPGEVDGTATAGVALQDVMMDAERTPMLVAAVWGSRSRKSKVTVKTGGSRELLCNVLE
ncbi:hypothetical protein HK101_001262 [Irineochytrium annulatum]|nr:hypothetical protein HK101_001262 [Irineochytrium annulatum]